MMNTRSNTSTTTPVITPTQTPEIRVRRVGLPGEGAVIFGGPPGTSAGCGVGVSDTGDSSLMAPPPPLDSDQKFRPINLIEIGPGGFAAVDEGLGCRG